MKIIPASIIQQQFWLNYKLSPDNCAYNVPSVFELTGELDLTQLEVSLNQIIRDYEIFRTNFIEKDNILLQQINDFTNIDINIKELNTSIPLNSQIKEIISKPFSLETDPLIKFTIFKESNNHYYFIILMHHIVCDLHTKNIFSKILSNHYNKSNDEVVSIHQYSEYIDWYNNFEQSEQFNKCYRFWESDINYPDNTISLPQDFKRPDFQSNVGDTIKLTINSALKERLITFSKDYNTKPFLILLTAYIFLLKRYSSQEVITVGVPLTNRKDESLKSILGCLMNIVPLEVTFENKLSFLDLLKLIRKKMLLAHRHQELPFQQITKSLNPSRNSQYNPIFQTGFTFEPPMNLSLENLKCRSLSYHSGGAQLDLFLTLWENDNDFNGYFEYCTELFSKDTVEKISDNYISLIENAISDPQKPLFDINILSDNERALLESFNNTKKEYPLDIEILSFFENQVKINPDKTALIFNSNQMTYAELNDAASKLSQYIFTISKGENKAIGILLDRSFEMVISIYAILKAGCAYVPLDVDTPEDRLNYMIDNCQLSLILSKENTKAKEKTTKCDVFYFDLDQYKLNSYSSTDLNRKLNPDNIAYIIYTSGSTGAPKGVMNTHRALCNRILWMQDELELNEKDKVLQKTPYTFDVSVWEFFWPLMYGGTLVIAPPHSHKDPAHLKDIIIENKISILHFVPSMLNIFLNNKDVSDCSSIKHVICSGETLPKKVVDKFFNIFDANLYNLYGPTEAAIDVTFIKCFKEDKRDYVPIGKPVANTQIHILDSNMQQCPINVPGEIYIGGIQVAKGYINNQQLTEKAFIPDKFNNLTKYKTGDLGRYRPDGQIQFLGRNDFQIKINGIRIEIEEIENVISAHPSVKDIVVTVKNVRDISKKLIAYYTLNEDIQNKNSLVSELQSHCEKKLPSSMIPDVFRLIKTIPLSKNGKVDRKALPDIDLSLSNNITEEPTSKLQKDIVLIWKNLLNSDSIDLNSNFFNSGGDSILAAQLVLELEKKLNQEISIVKVFQYPTVKQLSTFFSSTEENTEESNISERAQKRKDALLKRKRKTSKR